MPKLPGPGALMVFSDDTFRDNVDARVRHSALLHDRVTLGGASTARELPTITGPPMSSSVAVIPKAADTH